MSRRNRIWFVVAAILIVIGSLIFVGAFTVLNFDFTKLSTQNYETNIYDITKDFDKISIDTATAEIQFVPSEDGACRVECMEAKKVTYSAAVQDETLRIATVDTRKWYDHIGIDFNNPKMVLYLPKDEYTSLVIETDTGDVEIPDRYSFETVIVSGNTSDVKCCASVSDRMEIETDTGSMIFDNLCAGEIKLTTETGDIALTAVSCKRLSAKSNTGDMRLACVVAEDTFSLENGTGDIRFQDSDADVIFARSRTGDVTGSLLSGKNFITDTSTGSIWVPQNASGGQCEIKTSTGDIEIEIAFLGD